MREERTLSLVLLLYLRLELLMEEDSHVTQVGVLGAHQNEVLALS